MRTLGIPALAIMVGVAIGFLIAAPRTPDSAEATSTGTGFAAIPGEIGGQDVFGAYEVVPDWPKPMSQLPDHEQWTWGSVEGVFAESPNRVFVAQRGELPLNTRPESRPVPGFGFGIVFPVGAGGAFRNASAASPEDLEYHGTLGVDARWEHNVVVLDGDGSIIEEDVWTQWDARFRTPHAVHINPYDPEKHVWVVDEHGHAIYLVQLTQVLGNRLRRDGTIIPRGGFVGDPIHRVDVRLQQRLSLGRLSVDGVLEMFNVFNRANFGSWALNESSQSFLEPTQSTNIAYGPFTMHQERDPSMRRLQ